LLHFLILSLGKLFEIRNQAFDKNTSKKRKEIMIVLASIQKFSSNVPILFLKTEQLHHFCLKANSRNLLQHQL
jgi:hypothetical protein